MESILTINGGSSSIKFAVYENAGAPKRGLHGILARIGLADPILTVTEPGSGAAVSTPAPCRALPRPALVP